MSKPVCRFYSYNKNCRFGKNCRYLHTESQRPPPLQNPRHENEESSVKDQLSSLSLDKESRVISSSNFKNEESVSDKLHTSDPLKDASLSSVQKKIQDEDFASVEPLPSNQKGRKICQFFYRNGYCCFGRNCRFSHATQAKSGSEFDSSDVGSQPAGSQRRFQRSNVPPRFHRQDSRQKTQHNAKDNVDEAIKPFKKGVHQSRGQQTQKGRPQNQDGGSYEQDRRRICPFFKSGRCNRGQRCRFVHISSDLNEEFEEKSARGEVQDTKGITVRVNCRSKVQHNVVCRPGTKITMTFDEAEKDGTSKLRETEIGIIKKRFPSDRFEVLEDSANFVAKVIFIPSDPDWPYDVKSFELILTVPPEYPKETFSVSLPGDQDTPETVRRYVEVSIEEWLTERFNKMQAERRVELTFRPFLHWLDRAIEEITTGALQQLKRELVARAAGMTFIPAHKLQAKLRTQTESSNEGDEGDKELEEEDEEECSQSSNASESSDDIDDDDDDDDEDEARKPSLNLDPERKGTEIGLRNLQLKENAATLLFEKLMLIIQCGRCKNHAELRIPHKRVMSLSCEKCNHNQYIHFRPALIHQFSSIVGYLDVDGCKAFDLIFQECQAQVGCMACNKQTRINGFVSGQMIDGWCQACNARFKFATDAVKFSQLVPSGVETSNKVIEVAPSKPKKPPKDPAIREGHPLPEFGTCKHYKHSYRWLRFPCCGKAYPCDVCHDKKEDHEMVLANRMICGHCCKEQNYSGLRPCIACKQNLTKVHSSHWEGGSGCRDKIRMSKADQQKYKNMNKTVSNHQKKVQAGSSKKKTTKLRHA